MTPGWARAARLAARTATLLTLAVAASGCPSVARPNPADPLEGWNRGVQRFNDSVDEAFVQPVARSYRDLVPQPVRTGVTNFFGNLGDLWSTLNHVLQGNPEPALNMTLRVAVNTTFGLAGVLDIATEAGLDRHSEDFGQTLGRWGLPPGPYLVLPLAGPSSVRDTLGLPLDMAASAATLQGVGVAEGDRWAATALQVINLRANLLGATRLLEDVALDRYSFLRDAYLARRRNLVYDGEPPEPPEPRYDLEEAPK